MGHMTNSGLDSEKEVNSGLYVENGFEETGWPRRRRVDNLGDYYSRAGERGR